MEKPPSYKEEIKNANKSKYRWRSTSKITETIAQILLVIATTMSFAAGFFRLTPLSFVSGCLNIFGLSMLVFAIFAQRESDKQNHYLSGMLSRYNIKGSVSVKKEDS